MLTGQIILNDNGRLQVDTVELNAGDTITVLIVNGLTGNTEWIETTIEYGEGGYCLAGLWGYNPVGLFAKIDGLFAKV